jgi:hypothetical protein
MIEIGALLAFGLVGAVCAQVQGRGLAPIDLVQSPVPAYDAAANCRQLGIAAGGSALVEATCRDQEVTARAWLSSHMTTRHIAGYCRNLGDAAGGLLNVIQTCVVQEEKARAQLDREG